jgi:dihydrodipicolinate synthase/N-acetylneuraminate lyase
LCGRDKTALVVGVQTTGGDLNGAIEYARHAAKNGADAIASTMLCP